MRTVDHQPSSRPRSCAGCQNGVGLEFQFSMAFQPIVDVVTGLPFAYEALVRGMSGEGAASVLSQVTDTTRYAFDQLCRVKAIETAARLGLTESVAKLSINFLPNAVYSPTACIQLTLKTANAVGFPTNRLIFEFTENEQMSDPDHVSNIIAAYQKMGFGTALDDFGSGYAGLNLLARFQPDMIKLDMDLVRGLDDSRPRQVIIANVVSMCTALGVTVIAEGVETAGELKALQAIGIRYIQGHFFAKAAFEALPSFSMQAGVTAGSLPLHEVA
jgi:EAL domain-containing protein (putative c-di-GMP-specific phosphodiesterase class I)